MSVGEFTVPEETKSLFLGNNPFPVVSLAEGIELLADFVRWTGFTGAGRGRHNWAMVMKGDSGHLFVPRTGQPCYGEMRKYVAGEYRPSDLRSPWPLGLGLPVAYATPYKVAPNWYDLFLSDPESPYREIGKRSTIVKHGERTVGFVMNSVDVPSDLLANFVQDVRDWTQGMIDGPFTLGNWVLAHSLSRYYDPRHGTLSKDLYCLSDAPQRSASIRRWAQADPKVNPGLFSEAWPYTRSCIESIWNTRGVSDVPVRPVLEPVMHPVTEKGHTSVLVCSRAEALPVITAALNKYKETKTK